MIYEHPSGDRAEALLVEVQPRGLPAPGHGKGDKATGLRLVLSGERNNADLLLSVNEVLWIVAAAARWFDVEVKELIDA